MAFKTEFEFTLPKGYVDDKGNLHRKGVMRVICENSKHKQRQG